MYGICNGFVKLSSDDDGDVNSVVKKFLSLNSVDEYGYPLLP